MPKMSKPKTQRKQRTHELTALPADAKAELLNQLGRYGTQTKLAAALEVSVAVVSQLLNDKYPGAINRMVDRIRGKWMGKTVQCPVLRTISTLDCLSNQALPIAFTNPVRSALGHNCPKCPHRKELSK
jgi:DNA-directed RNA polymerase specialized sigma subunit